MRFKHFIAAIFLALAGLFAFTVPSYATEPSSEPSASASAEPSAKPSAEQTPVAPCKAYRYTGTKQSLCADFPDSEDVDCSEVGYRVTLLNDSDPWNLDGNKGDPGIGCESNPLKVSPSPSPSKTSPSPRPSRSTALAAVSDGPSLPLTGPSMGVVAGAGGSAVLLGVGVILMSRRRKARFEA